MPLVIGLMSLLIGGVATWLAMSRVVMKVRRELLAEHGRAEASDQARQRLEVDLAATRSEANRSAQLGIQVGQLSDQNTALERKCSSLATIVEERDRAIAEERDQWNRSREEFRQEVSQLTEEAAIANAAITQLRIDKSSLLASIEEREQALVRERGQLSDLKEQLKAQFSELSSNALKANSETFLDTAKKVLALQHQAADGDLSARQQEIKQLVKPLEEGIKAYDGAVRAMESERAKAFGSLEAQLRQSAEQTAEVARQASALKDALRKPNVRGRWGEVQLKNCIDLAGMDEHCDVTFQDSSETDESERIRPDMTVRMPGGRKVAVDAKTPMEFFLQYIDAVTEDERNAALTKHARAVKAHVAKLVKTDYMQKVAESPDFVVMFLPNESFLAMALEREPSLMEDSLSKKVLISTPATLIGLLKVIRYGWNEQRQTENAARITEEGKKLNTQLTAFLLDFAKLGAALKKASDAYEDSAKRIERPIANSSRRLAELNAASRKKLSASEHRLLNSRSLEDENDDLVEEPMRSEVDGENLLELDFGEVEDGSLLLAAGADE